MGAVKLFDEPFDLDEVEKLLEDDDFLSLSHLMIGREPNWALALEQVAALVSLFEESDRNYLPLYRLLSAVIERTAQLPNGEQLLIQAQKRLGLIPGVDYLKEIRMMQFRRENPAAWQAAQNQEWLAAYKASRRPPVTNGDAQTEDAPGYTQYTGYRP